MSEGGEGASLKYTPTWVVALVCTVIVAISLAVERFLHYAGKSLKKKNQKPLFEALQKVKEELMLMGFISLLMTVCQTFLSKICVHRSLLVHFLPCKLDHDSSTASSHFQTSFQLYSSSKQGRRLFSDETESKIGYCGKKDEVPLISQEALHQLHIFIFVLAIVHVTFCVLTILFGGAKIRQWKRWEDDISKNKYSTSTEQEPKAPPTITHVHEHTFVRDHFSGFGKNSALLGWLHSFVKQFYGSVTRSDYVTLRLGFIMMHCRTNPKFNFHNYMVRALEDDFRKVVGISWYLWVFVVIFLLLNVNGWHTYFWIAFIPFVLLLAVGTKLEHVIAQLASEVAEKHVAVEGDLVIQPSNDHFWFGRPRIVLFLIHFILFQNAFEIAFFFWIWVQYGFDSCIMGRVRYIVPRLIIGVFIQVLCSYSTLPLYAIVTQMGSHFKKAIFNENMQEGLLGWAQKAKKRKGLRTPSTPAEVSNRGNASIQMQSVRTGQEERDTVPLSDHDGRPIGSSI